MSGKAPPPDGLSERSQRVWEAEQRRAKSAGRLLMLSECLRHLDRADEVHAVIQREGLTTKTETTGTIHIHPLAKVEAQHRAIFVKLARALHLEWVTGVDGGRDD